MDTKKLRQKILDLAIHGKLVPQDPNDEPASVLLERIRAEKEQLIKEGKIKAPKESKSAGDKSHYPKEVPFEIPEGWQWCKITDVVDKLTDGTHNSPKSYPSGVYMYVTAKNIKRDGLDLSNITYVTKDVHQEIFKRCNPEKGDILYIKDGATCGISTINNLDEEFSLLSSVALIKPNKRVLNTYLNLFLQSDFCYRNVRDSMKGVGITRIILKQMELWDIPLPPFAEQKRIVAAAEQLLQITDGVERNQIALGKQIKKSKERLLDLAIHGKLVPQDSSEEPAIDLLRRINPGFKTSDNLHYLECPSGWAVTQMKSIIELFSGRDLENSRCNADGYGVPYLVGASCIDKGRINIYRWTETPEVISKEGDVLLSCKGTVGEVVLNTLGNLHIARQFMAIRSKAPQYILPDYIGIFIKASIETLKKAARGIITGISREDILELTVMIPPFEEQQRILSRIAEFNKSVSLIVANACN